MKLLILAFVLTLVSFFAVCQWSNAYSPRYADNFINAYSAGFLVCALLISALLRALGVGDVQKTI